MWAGALPRPFLFSSFPHLSISAFPHSVISAYNEGMKETTETLIPAGFITLNAVMTELGKSDSTIERLVSSGDLRSTTIPRPGRKPERVYAVEDVDRLKAAKARPANSAGAIATRPAGSAGAIARGVTADVAHDLIERLMAPKPLSVSEKLWLTIDEAAVYSGLAKADLRRLRGQGEIIARKSGGWKIQRSSLEAFARREQSVYVAECLCGAVLISHEAETRCGNCGRIVAFDFKESNEGTVKTKATADMSIAERLDERK